MTRPIKFRAWSGERMIEDIRLEAAHGIRLVCPNDLAPHEMSDDKCVLMQFTGLFDKNGVEIYEGNIVKQTEYHTDKSWYTAEVIYNRGRFCLNTGTIPEDLIPELCEVIGNIYENPELSK